MRRSGLFFALSLCFWFGVALHPAQAVKLGCAYLLGAKASFPLIVPKHDAAIEMELMRTPSLLKLLTTIDGTVKPALAETTPLPEEFKQWARSQGDGQTPFENLLWDELGEEMQIKVLQFVASQGDFKISRVIPGLKIREKMEIIFANEMNFLKRSYPAGQAAVVDLASLLKNLDQRSVHYVGKKSMPRVSKIEIHTRRKGRASDLMTDSWQLLEALGIPRVGQHLHLVGELPLERLHAEPIVKSMQMLDFYRRADLLAQFLSILRGVPIRSRIDEESLAIYFDVMSANDMKSVFRHLLATAENGTPFHFKRLQGWISLRSGHTYDEPNLWGFEVRSIGKNADHMVYGPFVDVLQDAMDRQDYGYSEEFIARWMRHSLGSDRVVENLIYAIVYCNGARTPWYLFFNALDHMEGLFQTLEQAHDFWNKTENNIEIQMLIHNWKFDPLVFEKPKALWRIKRAQRSAVQSILAGQKVGKVVRRFLFESGLLDLLAKSFGMKFLKNPNVEL